MESMKKHGTMFFAACMAVFLLLAIPANAEDKGWYLNFAGGVNQPSVEYHANTGFRLSASAGYNFTRNLGLELETGFLYNRIEITPEEIDSVISDISDILDVDIEEILDVSDLTTEGIRIDVKQVPVLVNFMLRFPNKSKWEPYAGFGMGGMYIMLPVSIPPYSFDLDTFELAYQPKIGLRRVINETMSFGVDYRYLGFGVQSVVFQTPLGNHSILFEFNKKF